MDKEKKDLGASGIYCSYCGRVAGNCSSLASFSPGSGRGSWVCHSCLDKVLHPSKDKEKEKK